MKRTVSEAQAIPAFYGVAYYDAFFGEAVTYPIPINHVVRAWLWIKLRLKKPRWGNALIRHREEVDFCIRTMQQNHELRDELNRLRRERDGAMAYCGMLLKANERVSERLENA